MKIGRIIEFTQDQATVFDLQLKQIIDVEEKRKKQEAQKEKQGDE